jgi:hypothetical protein
MDAIEVEQYMSYSFELDHDQLVKDTEMYGVPTHDQISKSIHEYFFFKKSCLLSFFECGSAYNK